MSVQSESPVYLIQFLFFPQIDLMNVCQQVYQHVQLLLVAFCWSIVFTVFVRPNCFYRWLKPNWMYDTLSDQRSNVVLSFYWNIFHVFGSHYMDIISAKNNAWSRLQLNLFAVFFFFFSSLILCEFDKSQCMLIISFAYFLVAFFCYYPLLWAEFVASILKINEWWLKNIFKWACNADIN